MSTTVKKVTLENATLVQLAEALATHATRTMPEINEYFIASQYKDFCYVSKNSYDYKVRKMDEIRAEVKKLYEEAVGTEVVDVSLETKTQMYQRMEPELEALEQRLIAFKQLYKAHTGKNYSHTTKSKLVPNSQAVSEAAKRIAGL